jgi:carbonic anhydrase
MYMATIKHGEQRENVMGYLITDGGTGGSMFRLKMIILVALVLMVPAAVLASAGGKAHWAYEGAEGPDNWGNLSGDYFTCKDGRSQSPINISRSLGADVGGLEFHYSAVPLRVVNNGHTVQVNYSSGSYMVVGGVRYDLLQFHFHSPSENTSNGKPYAMEAHLVHKSANGTLAVVGVFLKEGQSNSFVQKIWSNLPRAINQENVVQSVTLNANTLLPANKSIYHFQGSLTTPPCSEGVKWFVMKDTQTVSSSQVSKFLGLIGENARPTQPLNGRSVVGINISGGTGGGH